MQASSPSYPLYLFETIAHTAFGQDISGMSRVPLDLLPQIGDVQSEVVRFVAVFATPHFGEQRLVRQQAPGVVDQMIEQAVLGWAQNHLLSAYPHFTTRKVDAQIIVNNDFSFTGGGWHKRATQERSDAGKEFWRAKRFGEVIVRAEVQPPNLILLALAHS